MSSFVDVICRDVRKKDPLSHLPYLISLSVFFVFSCFSVKLFLIRQILFIFLSMFLTFTLAKEKCLEVKPTETLFSFEMNMKNLCMFM